MVGNAMRMADDEATPEKRTGKMKDFFLKKQFEHNL